MVLFPRFFARESQQWECKALLQNCCSRDLFTGTYFAAESLLLNWNKLCEFHHSHHRSHIIGKSLFRFVEKKSAPRILVTSHRGQTEMMNLDRDRKLGTE